MLQILVIAGALVLGAYVVALRRKNYVGAATSKVHEGPQLPEGPTWQWPLIGESLAFYNEGPYQFYCNRIKRYGSFFRTHVLGFPTIMTSSPEATTFVLATHHKSFRHVFPSSFTKLLLPANLSMDKVNEAIHYWKQTVRPDLLQPKIEKIDRATRRFLSSWESRPLINTFEETRLISFHAALIAVLGVEPCDESIKMLENFDHVAKGLVSPIQFDLPGTSYRNAIKKKEQINATMKIFIEKRKLEKDPVDRYLVDELLEMKKETGELLSDEEIANMLTAFMFAGLENPSALLVWLVKYLGENPKILREVKAEQESLRLSKRSHGEPLCVSDLEKTPITQMVLHETLRIGSVAMVLMREATKDMNFKGTLIPKGWIIQMSMVNFHLNPEYHKDPLKFDPSRFQELKKPAAFMPFGNGIHTCPARDVTKIEALIFLHYLVTNYSWEIIGPDLGVQSWPSRVPKGGLPIKVTKLIK
ncbi:hypothetical protein O6H91_10G064500 [Diphasiastrum complanatum]|uniref:Uncharacterized protein n=1 Tax=Diphasiastrum complanatum TaxID=34168 RepID=A0ACC2CHR9_DIPCM|nr:hypothetical protein O6H91_Y559100 [Diphasiastrum complanatum]KAJ7541549.1 hypothetical protein O6H91_10G064500 [Diphasiastrum complanatum]